jgi:ABC-type multidrug transport system fused ATPase/permease subunit
LNSGAQGAPRAFVDRNSGREYHAVAMDDKRKFPFLTAKKLFQILSRRELMQLLVLLLAIISMAVLQAGGVASLMPFISLVIDPGIIKNNTLLSWAYNTFHFANEKSFIIHVGAAIFLIILLSNAVSVLVTWMQLRFSWMNNHRLSRRLLQKYLYMPYEFFLDKNSADLSKNVLSEVNFLTVNFIISLLNVITKGITAVFH